MVDISKPSNAFGAFANMAFEEVYRENMAEAREKGGCGVCVDVGHEPMCAHRAWGGNRPKPQGPNVIIPDELYPWICTRALEHEGRHVGCTQDEHSLIEWSDEDNLRSSRTFAVTVSRMLEIYEYPIPGKFVRKPRLDLISQPGDITLLPIIGYQPNMNGTQQIRALTPWHECHVMTFDCPQEIFERLPNSRFCEGDLMNKKKQEHVREGISIMGNRPAGHETTDDLYRSAMELAETLSDLHPIENNTVREFFTMLTNLMLEYEQKHGMAV